MIKFKRLPSDIPPSVTGNNAALTETSGGVLILTDSDGTREIAFKQDVETAVNSAVNTINKELSDKADSTAVRTLAEQYNKAIEVINDLSERLTALESNYDPTVIK